ncbi:MAG: HDIG domain-containing protein [Treponema sp.]|nr:HDIG domain-containing protein [Treponema sp.]
MKKNNSKKGNEKNAFVAGMETLGNYVKEKYQFLLLMLAGILVVSALCFIKISTAQTIASFSIYDFEIGQIADRTIIADRTLSPDDFDPVSIQKGEKIIKKGFAITEDAYAKLKKMSSSPVYIDYRAFANNELYILLIALVWYLLYTFVPMKRTMLFREHFLNVVFFVFVYAMTAFCGKLSIFSSPYAVCIVIPSALVIMLVTILYGNFSAELFSFILSLGVLNASNWQLPTFIFTLFICLFSSVLVRKIERRLDLVFASIILALLEMVLILLIMVIFNENFTDLPKLLVGIAINGFLSGILTLGFLTPLEILLNTASVFRLMDLSDLNTPLMRKMLVSAGGTYNHSMMVAQLAENACRSIGANALIARVGAYYHDIGKIEQPEYFVENQKGQNKHDNISPTLSASVIKSHVRKGVEKARQMHLPEVIIDIIAEHHGNSVIAYFYNEAKEKDPSLSPEDFSYPGHPPTSRESAVVMLADTVEAACHTLENPSVPRLEKFITTLINGKVEHKQLDNCGLTFTDVSKIKEAFVQVLAGYYHTRIEYPDQKDPAEEAKESKEAKDTKDVKEAKTSEVKRTEAKGSEVKSPGVEKKDGK